MHSRQVDSSIEPWSEPSFPSMNSRMMSACGTAAAGNAPRTGSRRMGPLVHRPALGGRFDGRVLPGECANPNPPFFFRDVEGSPHSVVTAHLVDQAGHPTLPARDEILSFLAERL